MDLVQSRLVTDDVPSLATFYAVLAGVDVVLNDYYLEIPALTMGFSQCRFSAFTGRQDQPGLRRGEIVLDFSVSDVDREFERISRLGVELGPAPNQSAMGRTGHDLPGPGGSSGQRLLSPRGGAVMSAAVEAIDLVKTYPGDVQAVKSVSLEVQAGEAFGLLGPNGAGKTTTIGMLNSTVKPTSGRAILGGLDVARDPIGTRAISSVVFQEPVVDRTLTGRQNLMLHLKLWGVPMAEGLARLEELSSAVGLNDFLARPVATYSGGQRRRLEMVRALLSAPQVLFLDEPTVGLDIRVRHDLFDVIGTLRDRTAVTIIMTTHYLEEAERLCDRLAVIDAGTIVACDTPANLLALVGPDVVELRVEDPQPAMGVLARAGLAGDDIVVIGTTVTASLRGVSPSHLQELLAEQDITLRSFTTRPATLDDVYLRLTGKAFS